MKSKSDGDGVELGRRRFVQGAVATTLAVSIGCSESPLGPDASTRDASVDRDAAQPADSGLQDAGEDASDSGGGDPDPVDPPETFTESSSDFPLGVASGDVTSGSAIFWTSYAGSSAIELVVWEMDGDAYLRTVHVGEVLPALGGHVHEDVDVIEAGKRYRYTFFTVEGGARTVRSAVGRMRAAISADSMESLLIGAVCCTNNSRSLGTLGHAGARTDLDFFIYGGDTTYNDGARSLSDFRTKWEEQIGRAEYQAVRGSTSALATWDDHEFDNNFDPETLDAAQRRAAVEAFFEYQPMRREESEPDRVWKRMRWGRTADIFVLDCRNERMPSTRGGADQYISREQMDWLKSGLTSSAAVFKIIVNTVPITDMPGLFDVPSAQNDRWEGYPTQREEILRHIDDAALSGVLWISGDFHLASAQRVGRAGDPGESQVELLVGPGAQSANPLWTTLRGDQFDFASGTNNYTVLELLPSMTRVRASWIDSSGSAFEVREYNLGA